MRLTKNLNIALDKINRSASATDKSECYKLDQLQTEVKLPTLLSAASCRGYLRV